MPELPEVEVTCQGLIPHLLKRQIVSVCWSNKRLRLPVPRKLLREKITNNRISAIGRRAKYVLIRFQDGSVLIFHLGMTGKLGMFKSSTPAAKHDHLRLLLDNNLELRFNDVRRFGSVSVWPAERAESLEQTFNKSQGIEPFGPLFTGQHLFQLAQQRSVPVKTFLMDSRVIAGIGNIYANETLFAAGIHPQTKVNTLTKTQWQRISKSCQVILKKAINAGGSTISDFLGSSGQPGYFQLQLAVYGKKGESCSQCGKSITKTSLAGRATFFCSHCQPL
ncbi:MAG: formamidopyrimidine-DNA glycosylase [Desulfobulbus sp.]|nr:MAG: formamidopyrimidine-DNA glycosylase [Desulfobulbus sp.]